MSYNQFKNLIKQYGLSSPNRFEVEIPLPRLLAEETTDNTKKINNSINVIKQFLGSSNEIVRGLSLMCNETELPGLQIATSEVSKNGNLLKMPYGILYQNIPMTFLISSELYEKNIIDKWVSKIVNKKTNNIKFYDDYVTDITIHQLDKQDRKVKSIVLKEAFPITVNSMPLNMNDRNTFHRLSVEFSYKKWFDRNELYTEKENNFLENTALYPYVNDILNNPITRSTLDFLKNNGLDLEGESANIYNQINNIIEGASGQSINRLLNILNEIKGDTNTNNKISSIDKANLIKLLDSLIGTLRGN